MADYLVGQTAYDDWALVDASNNPILLAGYVARVNTDPDGLAFPYLIEEKGSGNYQVSFLAAKPGIYTLQLKSLTTPPQRFLVSITVAQVPAIIPPSIGVGDGYTLLDAVREVALANGDYQETMATATTGTGTWVDTLNLAAMSPQEWAGSELYVWQASNPANVGKLARVVGSQDMTLTLSPELPAAVTVGDQADLFNISNQGARRNRYVNVINACLRDSYPEHKVPYQTVLVDPWNSAIPSVVLPSQLTRVSYVEWLDTQGVWHEIPMAYGNMFGWYGWAVDESTASLWIGGGFADWANGNSVRVSGYGRPAVVAADTDMIDVPLSWLRPMANYFLMTGTGNTRDLAKAQIFLNEANTARLQILTPEPANTVRVRP